MATMAKTIRNGFRNDGSSDFLIICGDRIFEVHKVVLREQGFFEGLLNGSAEWTETQERRIELEEDPKTFELFLKHLYGLPFIKLCEGMRAPLHQLAYVNRTFEWGTTQMMETVTVRVLAAPARPNGQKIEKQSFAHYQHLMRYRDPLPEVSAFHCVELLNLAKLYELADRRLVPILADKTSQQFANLLCDCWSSPAILEVIDFVFSYIREGTAIRNALELGIRKRQDLLRKEPKFRDLIRSCPEAAIFLALVEKPGCSCKYYAGLVYCSSFRCRANVVHKLSNRMKEIRTCKECKDRSVHEVKTRMWPQEEGQYGLMSIDPAIQDTGRGRNTQAEKESNLMVVPNNDFPLATLS